MQIILDKGITFKFTNKTDFNIAKDIVLEDLKHENIEYKKSRIKLGIEEYIYSFEDNYRDLTITIPRGCGEIARRIMNNVYDNKKQLIDKTSKGKDINFKHKFSPRDNMQIEAVNGFVNDKRKNLILNAICGFGKTVCALFILERISKTTLILVDENLLLNQWKEAIEFDSNFDINKLGIIGNGKEEYIDKDIIIGSKDTLINRPDIMKYLKENIGFVIVDEAHVASASIFQNVLKELSPNRVLGLTATPKRSDGLDYLMHEQIGPIYYKASREELIKIGSVMKPYYIPILVKRQKYFEEKLEEYKKEKEKELSKIVPDKDGKYKIGNRKYKKETWKKKIEETKYIDMDWNFLSRTVEQDNKTIKEISKLIKKHYDNNDQSICICKKIDFAKKYKKELISQGVKEEEICLILGETKVKERNELIERAKNKDIKIIITSKILDKGISINSANILFLLYPSKTEANTEQRIGRVSRTSKGKEYAIVYDFIYDHGMFFSQLYKNNSKEYKECRWNVIKECCVINKNIEDFIFKMFNYFYKKEKIDTKNIDFNNMNIKEIYKCNTIWLD